ncbi:MAG: hypothetical protein IJ654_09225 [Bacteroidales bacterium]|nr:hypothetical protein [Bacteroidales bacterium]
MPITIQLPLLPGWRSQQETLPDHGAEIFHLEAYLPDDRKQSDIALIDLYAGDMPDGSDAGQEALNSYRGIVGDDDEDPLTIWPFQGKEAYGYELICDDDAIMRVMCLEPIPGQSLIINIVARDEDLFDTVVTYVETHLSIL